MIWRWMKIIYIKTMKTLLCIIILSYLSIWRGEILRWNLDSGPSQKPTSISSAKVLGHNRPVFCMCAGGLNSSLMCTVSMDRQVCLVDVGVLTLHSIYMCIDIGYSVFFHKMYKKNWNWCVFAISNIWRWYKYVQMIGNDKFTMNWFC